jgi:hypothetical protein
MKFQKENFEGVILIKKVEAIIDLNYFLNFDLSISGNTSITASNLHRGGRFSLSLSFSISPIATNT